MTDEVKVKSELLDEFDAENGSLEERLKNAHQRIQTMQARIEMLEQGQRNGDGGGLLNITDKKEFYDYEQYDLIMTILTNALQNYASDTRAHELLSAIIEANPIKGYGRDIFERIKQIFAKGEGIGNKEFAELKEFQDRPFKQLSSGMKSRLAFSIASLVQPDILILDEVLSVGDGAFRKKSEAKMREIIQGGATTILVSHSVQQVRELCNKVLWLEKGEQVAFGETDILCDLYRRFLDKEITLQQAKDTLVT